MQRMLSSIFFLVLSLLAVIPLQADSCASHPLNLVFNCGFETGAFDGWALSGTDAGPPYYGIAYGVDQADANSGNFGAYLGGFGGVLNVSQTVSTVPGTTYAVTYWLAQSPATISPYQTLFSFNFGGVQLSSMTQVANLPYTQYSLLTTADSAAGNLVFGFRDDTGFFSLDDVSVVPVAVPEPASFDLLPAALVFGILQKLVKRSVVVAGVGRQILELSKSI